MQEKRIAVIGGGLAGCECAFALAEAGFAVTLFEMRPEVSTPAHSGADLAELVCSNSFRSTDPSSAIGLLKREMRVLGSLVMRVAEECSVPAGKALAVDRALFARRMTQIVSTHPRITLERREVRGLNPAESPELAGFDKIALCAGPLASPALADALTYLAGVGRLYFYDAIAPIVHGSSINMDIAFRGSRYGKDSAVLAEEARPAGESASAGDNRADASEAAQNAPDVEHDAPGAEQNAPGMEQNAAGMPQDAPKAEQEEGDYINCPMTREEYFNFREELLRGEKAKTKDFEKEVHFEGCMPIETLAERGEMTMAFGPLKPVGFVDPRTGRRPFALLQLRAENLNRSMFNLVGCQTKLSYPEQERIFRLIPGLEKAEFARLGSMHRNTFVNAPLVLDERLALRKAPHIHLAGQITGVEGYVESAACGLWLGLLLTAELKGSELPDLPVESALGGIMHHLRRPVKNFQPSNAQFGLMPELGEKARKKNRKALYAQRTEQAFTDWREKAGL